MAESTATWEVQVALQSLPTCQRCQQHRKKCDPGLPACQLCQKAGVECLVYDHALKQALPRKYIESLLSRLNHLKGLRNLSLARGLSTSLPGLAGLAGTSARASVSYSSFDHLFTIPTATGTTHRFHGSSSVFSLAVEVLTRASSSFLYTPSPTVQQAGSAAAAAAAAAGKSGGDDFGGCLSLDGLRVQGTSEAFRDMTRSLVKLYMRSVSVIYPLIDEGQLGEDLELYFGVRAAADFDAAGLLRLQGQEAYQYFRISMMCAIACASKARHQAHLMAYAQAFYGEAVQLVAGVTCEVSFQSLQALLLLTLYCLFLPRSGSIWNLLDFACRLSVQVGCHTKEYARHQPDEGQRNLRRNTFWTLYSVERLLGQSFGRPSDLPENMISTEYPEMPAPVSRMNHSVVQRFAAAHVFRLKRLRSDIYTALYLPLDPQPVRLDWFLDRYAALLQWRHEIDAFADAAAGCGTTTCSLLFHASVIYLFQPILLRTLSQTRSVDAAAAPLEPIPSESYYAACDIIRIYDRIVRAPESSELGAYPMTFLSAYSIWLAAMALMAHCLLTIDGRVDTLKLVVAGPPPHCPVSSRRHRLDYSDIFDLSATCLLLLAWCADKWPGMEGMKDAYHQLSQKVLPVLVESGHVLPRGADGASTC